jgi:hypothetical protein
MDLRYPVGEFVMEKEPLTDERRRHFIDQMAATPKRLADAVAGLSAEQLDTPYRPGGWTARQVAHHFPDSHMNGYVRVKLALTETEPALKIYEESDWAKLPDTAATPVEVSLELLEALHRRWVVLMRSLTAPDFRRTARHPSWGIITVDFLTAQYAWHGRHHVAHITSLRDRMGWKS